MKERYNERGVSSQKEDVHKAIEKLDKGLFPGAFCKIIPDLLSNDAGKCCIIHADGAGTKSSLAYIYWKETGDVSVWRGIAQDAIAMNTDDLLCVGVADNFIISSAIGRNKKRIPGEVITELIHGAEEFLETLRDSGISISSGGGETADVGDLVKTVIVDSTLVARPDRDKIIKSDIKAGQVIVGLASDGKAVYERSFNSGMGSNGLTSARHDLFSDVYRSKYPESFDDLLHSDLAYTGNLLVTDLVDGLSMNAGQMVLSPTRTYLPVFKVLLNEFRSKIGAIIHCTGGGQTKVLHFADKVHIVKDNVFPPPVLFQMIQSISGSDWSEMYRVFNMGHRMEIYTDEHAASEIMSVCSSFGIDSRIIGRVESSSAKKLSIHGPAGILEY
jgi:phosphoribosylformylglycinamidine cyclo-ligase